MEVMSITREEVASAFQELKEAVYAMMDISVKMDKLGIAKSAAQKRLALARDEVRSLTQSL